VIGVTGVWGNQQIDLSLKKFVAVECDHNCLDQEKWNVVQLNPEPSHL
jgi:hypothetical protein